MTPPRGPKKVLIVDDYPDTAETAAVLLSVAGHEVRVAGDGASALASVVGWCPDACLLDLRLPDMTGHDLARLLVARCATRPVLVAVTGDHGPARREASRTEGFDHHLLKPADPAEILGILHRVA